MVASGHQDEDRQDAYWPNFHFTLPITQISSIARVKITLLSADNRCQPAACSPFHDTYNAETESAEQIIGQGPGLHFTLPIKPTSDGSDEQIIPLSADNASQQPEFHFTIPIIPMPDGPDERFTSLSADNASQQPEFHFTIPIMRSPADSDELITPVVS